MTAYPNAVAACNAPDRQTRDAGITGLKHQIAHTPSAELLDWLSLLVELPPELLPCARWRMRLCVWELQARSTAQGTVAA